MPTKVRRCQVKAREDLIRRMPIHIAKRVKARHASGIKSEIIQTLLESEPSYIKLKGGLVTFDKYGKVEVHAKGDPTGSANEERACTRKLNIESIAKKYPQYIGRRGGAKAIALSEEALPPEKRAVKPTKLGQKSISERTVQSYLVEIRKANKMP